MLTLYLFFIYFSIFLFFYIFFYTFFYFFLFYKLILIWFPFYHLCFFPHLSTYSSFWSCIHVDPVLKKLFNLQLQTCTLWWYKDQHKFSQQSSRSAHILFFALSSIFFFFFFVLCFDLVFQGRWETFKNLSRSASVTAMQRLSRPLHWTIVKVRQLVCVWVSVVYG